MVKKAEGIIITAGTVVIAVALDQNGTDSNLSDKSMGFSNNVLDELTINSYSRTKETEADLIGFFLMADAAYNAENAIKFWREQVLKLEIKINYLKFFQHTRLI